MYSTRVIAKQGASRSLINGRPCPLQLQKELSDYLVSLHGQHQHQLLLKTPQQRELLDHFAGHENLLTQVKQAFFDWQNAAAEVNRLQQQMMQGNAKDELLTYQVEELDQLNLAENEFSELDQQHKKLANADELQQAIQQALDQIKEQDQAVLTQVNHALNNLSPFTAMDPSLANITKLLEEACISLEEAARELQLQFNHYESDPAQLHIIEQRLNLIFTMARKQKSAHRKIARATSITQNSITRIGKYRSSFNAGKRKSARARKSLFTQAIHLSKSRQKASKKLATEISELMPELGMIDGHFSIELTPTTDGKPSLHGMEQVQFQVQCNPGQPRGPLAKVASGGELSRLALAIYVSCAKSTTVPCLIFDEVDVGISGSIADVVGQLLRRLAKNTQILCITHLPQVAAYGTQHLHVSKHTQGEKTHTQIQYLNHDERIEEMASMLSGQKAD